MTHDERGATEAQIQRALLKGVEAIYNDNTHSLRDANPEAPKLDAWWPHDPLRRFRSEEQDPHVGAGLMARQGELHQDHWDMLLHVEARLMSQKTSGAHPWVA